MSQHSCCVPGCAVVKKDGVPLHRFPNPERSGEKFTTWILNIGGEIAIMDHRDIYDNRRVCHRHFEDIHKYPSGRLSKLAIPTMHISDLQAQSLGEAMVTSESDISQISQLQKCGFNTSEIELIDALSTPTLASTSNIETIISKPALASPNVEAIISNLPLSSTSNVTQSNISAIHTDRQNNLELLKQDTKWKQTKSNVYVCENHFGVSSLENSKMSDAVKMETSPTPLPSLLCICCLQEEFPLISLRTCSHAEFLNTFMMPEIKPNEQVVCWQCHEMLKKIKLFTLQVEESFKVLSDSTTENTSKRNNQKRNLTIHKLLNIDIPQTSTKDNIKTTDNTEKSLASQQNTEKKTKIIEEALKIINGNQNNGNLDIITTSLQSLSQTLITEIFNEFQLNKTNLITTKSEMNTTPLSTKNTAAISSEDEMKKENVEKDFGNNKWYQLIAEKDFPLNVSENKVQTENLDASYGDYPNLKQLTLTKEELMQERAKLASSPGYRRSRYRCKSCLIGFQYRANLTDHVKTKHTIKNKESFFKCKVCRQCVKRDLYYNHTFWHYNRYKCLSCGLQFGSYDLAVLHYTKKHNTSGNTELKCPQCSYKTFRKSSFKNHLLICKSSKLYQASHASRKMLQIHMLTQNSRTSSMLEANRETITHTSAL